MAQTNAGYKICDDANFDASKSSSLYVDGLAEVRVNALCALNLIRAY